MTTRFNAVTTAALMLTLTLTLALCLTGCDRKVSSNTSTTVKKDGTVKQQETTVTEHSDGSVTKEETKTTTNNR